MKKNLASVCAVLVALSVFSIKAPAQAFNWHPWKKAPVKVEKPVVQPEVVQPAAPVAVEVKPAQTMPCAVNKPCTASKPCTKVAPAVKKPAPAVKKAVPAVKKAPCKKK